MLSADSHESTLCPACRRRTILDGIVCRDCYDQLAVYAVEPQIVPIPVTPATIPLRVMLLLVAMIAVALAVSRTSLMLGASVGIVLILTVLLGQEQIQLRKSLGPPMSIREEAVCFLAMGVAISLALLGLFGVFLGVAMAVTYVAAESALF